MYFLQKIQELFFANILELQESTMESKFAFTLAMALKFILKEGFILMFLLLPINVTQTLRQLIVDYSPTYDIAISICTFVVIILILFTRIHGLVQNQLARTLTISMVPWVDVFGFPVLMVLVVLVSTSRNHILTVLNIITIVLVSITQLIYNIINFSKSPKSKNLFHCRQANVSLLSNFILLVFYFYVLSRWVAVGSFYPVQVQIYTLLLFGLSAIKIKQKVLKKYCINSYAQTVSSFTYFLELSLSVGAVVYNIIQLEVILTNLPFLVIVMTLLSYHSMITYLNWRENQFILSNANEMKEEGDVMMYLDCLLELACKSQNEVDDIMLISLRKSHEMSCSCSACFCNFSGKPLKTFIKEYITCQLNTIADQFPNSPSLLISIIYFKMVMLKLYPQILAKVNEYRSKFNLSFRERFYCHWLTRYLKTYIQKKNQEISAVESQHIFELESLKEEIESIIRSQVEMRQKKWKYLSRGLCRIQELEDQCSAELKYVQRMLKIYQENKEKLKRSKEFNLLMLFYFLKVSFLNNGKELRANLKEIYYGIKLEELRSLKEFKKYIFHENACALETMIDSKAMGVITLVSDNVEELFGVPQKKVKGASINSLMPEFMGKEHEHIMERWFSTSSWQNMGRLKEVFCVHKQQYCFSALLYIKMYVRDNSLYLITTIFKLNDEDYLILSPDGRIQGQGRKFKKVLGEEAKSIPIHLLIERTADVPEKEEFETDKPIRRVFMGLRGMEDQAVDFTEEEAKIVSPHQKQELAGKFYQLLKTTSQVKYFVEFQVQNYTMGKLTFPVLKILETRAIEKKKTVYLLNHVNSGLHSLREHLGEELEVERQSSNNREVSKEENDEEGVFQQMANTSMASTSEKENYPLSKLLQKIIALLMNPEFIKDRKIYMFTIIFVILVLLLGLLNFLSYFFYNSLLLEVKEFFFADGAVSDIMQTTQIAYAHAYQLRSQLLAGKITDFQSDLRTARYVNHYVQGLKEYSFAHLLTDRTAFSHEKLYGYIEKPAIWTQINNTVEIDTYQFLEHMYYLTSEMLNQLQKLKQNNKTEVDTLDLQRIVQNFPQMQAMNKLNLIDYYQSAVHSQDTLNKLTIGSMVFFIVITLTTAFAVNAYYRFRFASGQQSFKFLSLIPNQLVQRMKDYYRGISRRVLDANLLKTIDQHQQEIFAIETHHIGKVELSKISSKSSIKLINYSSYYRWIIIAIVFLAVNGFNYFFINNVRVISEPTKVVMELVNALMRGQNRLLEIYFDLKAEYYLNQSQGFKEQFFDKVQDHLNGAEDKWCTYANQLSALLLNYSPQYQQQFKSALTTNVCHLGVEVLPDYKFEKCLSELQLNMLDGGIMISMNFFRGTVQEAIISLKKQYLQKTVPEYAGNYFLQVDFTDLDKMEIYMFKIYQLTQEICYNAFIKLIDSITYNFLLYSIVFCLIEVVFMVIWFATIKAEKKKLSKIYARLILVPFGILRSNARIVSCFKEATEYCDD